MMTENEAVGQLKLCLILASADGLNVLQLITYIKPFNCFHSKVEIQLLQVVRIFIKCYTVTQIQNFLIYTNQSLGHKISSRLKDQGLI